MSDNYWDQKTKDRWFFGFLVLTIVAVALLFSPYLWALLFSAVVAVVSWPMFRWFEAKLGQRRTIAALLTIVSLFVLVLAPLATVGWLFVTEAIKVTSDANSFFAGGQFDALADDLSQRSPPQVLAAREWIETWLPDGVLPPEGTVAPAMAAWLRSAALTTLGGVGGALPALLEGVFGFGLDFVIFVFALGTLYLEGPRLLIALMHLSPMEDRYERKLFAVFQELANNMVLATLITAIIQGVVSGLAFHICGLRSAVFLGVLAGVCSFIPLAGTGIIWIPCAVVVGFTQGWGWALFLAIYSLLFTGSVDNVIKPLVMRGSTRIHPLLIFLAVFGGLAWFGPVGFLVGPLIVAFFLAAYTIYMRDYLDVETGVAGESLLPTWVARWLPFLAPPAPGRPSELPQPGLPASKDAPPSGEGP
ncbi:MAG: putative PurR-regulated permease PerM [Myxococcota bacterium]